MQQVFELQEPRLENGEYACCTVLVKYQTVTLFITFFFFKVHCHFSDEFVTLIITGVALNYCILQQLLDNMRQYEHENEFY